LFKIIGIAAVFFVFVMIACEMAGNYKNKYLYIYGIINGITYLKKEIEYFNYILEEAFINSADFSGTAKEFFLKVGESLKGNKCVNLGNLMADELLTSDDRFKKIILEFGNQIGKSNVENEIITIDNTLIRLNDLYEEYKEEYKKKGTFVYKITILCGIIFVIVIM
jgi:stage III sporulation protein AB